MKNFIKVLLISSVAIFLISNIGNTASFRFGGIKHDLTGITTAATTTTLTASSTQVQVASGSTTQTFKLPSATTLANGYWYKFVNDQTATSSVVTVKNSADSVIKTVAASSSATLYLGDSSTAAGKWYVDGGSGSSSSSSSGSVGSWSSITLSGMCSAGTSQSMFARLEGSDLHVRGSFTCGTVENTTGRFTITGYTIDSTKLSSNSTPRIGTWLVKINASTQMNASAQTGDIFYDGSDTAAAYIANTVVTYGYGKINNWQSIMGGSNNELMEVDFLVPVQ